jgi:hypothetical protein
VTVVLGEEDVVIVVTVVLREEDEIGVVVVVVLAFVVHFRLSVLRLVVVDGIV